MMGKKDMQEKLRKLKRLIAIILCVIMATGTGVSSLAELGPLNIWIPLASDSNASAITDEEETEGSRVIVASWSDATLSDATASNAVNWQALLQARIDALPSIQEIRADETYQTLIDTYWEVLDIMDVLNDQIGVALYDSIMDADDGSIEGADELDVSRLYEVADYVMIAYASLDASQQLGELDIVADQEIVIEPAEFKGDDVAVMKLEVTDDPTIISPGDKDADEYHEDAYYSYWTNDPLQLTVTIYGGQPEYYIYRIYFKPVDAAGVYAQLIKDGILQDEINDQIVFYQENADGKVTLGDYTATKEWDEDEEAWYLEFTDIDPENTAGGTLHLAYPSPTTPGGDLIIYGVMYDATTKNIVSSNREAFDANWKTSPEGYEVAIELDEEQAAEGLLFQLSDDGSSTHVAVKGNPDQDIIWEVSMDKKVDSLADEGIGEDLIRSIEVTDTITLPAGVIWGVDLYYADPTISKVLNDEGETEQHIVFSDLLGNELLTLINKSNNAADGYELSYDAQSNKLILTWTIQNSTGTVIPSSQIESGIWEIRLNGDYVLLTDEDEFNAASVREIGNTVKYNCHYCWSEDQPSSAEANIEIAKPSSSVELTKTTDRDGLVYMGEDASYTISIYNQGVYATTNLSALTDELDSTQYISAAHIWDMFFVEKEEDDEDYDEYVDENSGDYLTLTISNAMVYYSTEQALEYTVDMNGNDDRVYKTNANYAIDQNPEHKAAVITIEKSKSGDSLSVTFADGSWSCGRTVNSADALEMLFLQMGYVVTKDAAYSLEWTLSGSSCQLAGGETRHFKVYSSMKNTFQYYENLYLQEADGFNTADNTVVLSYNNEGKSETDEGYKSDQSATAEYTNINPDFHVEKAVTQVDGEDAADTDVFYRGSVITYRLRVRHFGTAVAEDLPLVDVCTGSQYLLVPVNAKNMESIANLYWNNETYWPTVEYNGVSYYQFIVGGTFKNVWFDDNHCAATVVTDISQEYDGSETPNSVTYTITWNYDTFDQDSDDVYYNMLIKSDTKVTSVQNIVYLNGRYTENGDSRVSALYDQIDATEIKSGTLQKQILTSERDADAEDESYAVSSVLDLNSGNSYQTTVRYKLQLETKSGNSQGVTFNNVKDILPYTYGIFNWDENNVDVYSSVYVSPVMDEDNNEKVPGLELSGEYSIYYSDEDGTEVYADGDGNYLLEDGNPAYQTIDWGTVTVPAYAEGVWIYVELTFAMGADDWADYTNKISGNLKNTVSAFIDNNTTPDTANVIHSVKKNAKAYLQKGVYWINTPTGVSGANTSKLESREVYYNSSSDSDGSLTEGSRVAYYIQIYNASSGYLYLQDIQDVVPDGFTFVGLYSGKSDYLNGAYDSIVTTSTSTSSLVSGLKGSDIEGVTGAPAWVKAVVAANTGEDGILRFTVRDGDLNKDDTTGCFYLDQGEAVSFIAEFQVGEMSETDKYAVNKIAMPYLDLSGVDELAVADVEGSAVDAATTSAGQNTGGCEILDETQRTAGGFGAVTTEIGEISEWLYSEVEVRRGEIIPGIDKSVDSDVTTGYAGTVVDWTIEVSNNGTVPMSNYTISDIMQDPYLITGDVTYTIYDSKGNVAREMYYDSKLGLTEIPLFSISRESSNITYYRGYGSQSLAPSSVDYSIEGTTTTTIHPGIKKDNGNPASVDEISVDVTISTDDDGSDRMTIAFGSSLFAIPVGGYGVLKIHTGLFGTDTANGTYYNLATITPTQEFDETLVSIGDAVTENVSSPYVKSSDQVHASGGYSTGSQKWIWNMADDGENQTYKIARSQLANLNGVHYIELDDQTETFTYTLEVTNSLEKNPMSNLIIVDSLPQSGDYAPFATRNENTARESKFQVDLLDDPDWRIVKGTKDTAADALNTSLPWETLLDTDDDKIEEITDYTIYYSTYTDFGKGMDSGKWSLDSKAEDGSDFWTTDPTGARSIRIEINEEVEKDKAVQISFDAVISADSEDDAEPGEIGWNSFAYKYTTKSTETGSSEDVQLWAAPRKVGVKIPDMPRLKKELLGISSDDADNLTDQTFRFLIHEGDQLSTFDYTSGFDDDESTYSDDETVSKLEWDLITALKAEDPQRAYFITELTVSGGTSETITLDPDSAADTDKYGDFAYVEGKNYTIVELPSGSSGVAGNDQFKSAYMSVLSANKQENKTEQENVITFAYTGSEVIQVTADNRIIEWALKVLKVDQDSKTPISGVVFGLYSSDKPAEGTFDALEEVYGDLLTTPSDAEKITIDGEDGYWYLIDVKTTDAEGSILWTGLTDSIYYLKELQAADGYYVPADPIPVDYWNTDENQQYGQSADGTYQIVTKTVTNKVGYLLPKSGGHGTLWIQLLGLLLMSMGVSLTYITKRKITSSRRTK